MTYFHASKPAAETVALAACSPTVVTEGIFWRVLMAMNAVSLLGFFSHETRPAHHVLSVGNCLKMVRVYAELVPAKMVYVKAFLNAALSDLIADSVCLLSFAFCSGHVKHTVTPPVRARCPYPASLSFSDLCPKVIHRPLDNAFGFRCKA